MQRHEPEIDVVGWYPYCRHHPIVLDKVACVARESVAAELRQRATAVVWSQRLFEDVEERKMDRWTLHTNVKEGRFEQSRQKEPRDEAPKTTVGACPQAAQNILALHATSENGVAATGGPIASECTTRRRRQQREED